MQDEDWRGGLEWEEVLVLAVDHSGSAGASSEGRPYQAFGEVREKNGMMTIACRCIFVQRIQLW